MTETTNPCTDCVRLKTDRALPTRYCPADGFFRCREHRAAHLGKQGVGAPVKQPPASVGRQGSFL